MSKQVTNQIMLITYADCMGNNLKDLDYVLTHYLQGAVSGLHILPFFPSSGDRGFAPLTYKEVDPAFGGWEEVLSLADRYYMMYDYMINHLSAESDIYKDFLAKKDDSEYRDFFIRYKDFWPENEPTEEQISKMYLRRAQPYIEAQFADGSTERLWCTFSPTQIDINCLGSEKAKEFMEDNLRFLSSHGASLIRLDALAYATKRRNTNCFFVEPEIWQLINQCQQALEGTGSEILPEIHENYFIQKKLEEKDVYTYDFQLPMLILNAVYFGRTLYLKDWMKLCPRKQFTTLDTHDGIGVVDVAGLLEEDEIELVCENVEKLTEEARKYIKLPSTIKTDGKKVRRYQLGTTYYSALDCNDDAYLLARAVQFFTPGIPQVYYVGLLAGENDIENLKNGGEPRSINRHNYSEAEIDQVAEKPVVQKLCNLMRFRNQHPAFNGDITVDQDSTGGKLHIRWDKDGAFAALDANFQDKSFQITYTDVETGETKTLAL